MKKGKFQASKTKGKVSFMFEEPQSYKSVMVLAHGAGTDMNHVAMSDISSELLKQKIAVFRFNFPYKEAGKGGPNPQPILLETIRNAIIRL